MLVVDASTALSWFIPGQRTSASERAWRLGRRSLIVVPSLWLLETQQGLLRLGRQQVLTGDEISAIRLELALMHKRVDPTSEQDAIDRIWELANRNMLTFYDATYVELAWRLNLPVASNDSAIITAARRHGLRVV